MLLTPIILIGLPFFFFAAFSDLQIHDDQGTLMITFRQILDGEVLYRDMMALYGPFYYLAITPFFSVLKVPLSHDASRLISILFWIACSAMFGSLVWRLTRSVVAGAFALVTAMFLFKLFSHSPLHPQELSFLLVGVLLHLVVGVDQNPRAAHFFIIGAIVGAILLTKVNLAAFIALPLLLAALRATTGGAWLRAAHWSLLVIGPLIPFVLMAPLLHLDWAVRYCLFASGTLAAALVVWSSSATPKVLTFRMWWLCALGFVVSVAVILAATMAASTTAHEILQATVLQHFGLVQNWYIPAPISLGAVVVTAISLAYAVYFARARAVNLEGAMQRISRLKAGLGVFGCLSIVVASFIGIPWKDLPISMFQFLVPFSWLMMVPNGSAPIARGVLGLTAAFLALYAFPVAGTQIVLASILPAVMLPLFLKDGARTLRVEEGLKNLAGRKPAAFRSHAGAIAFLLLLAMLITQTYSVFQRYRSQEPVDLRGTTLVRTDHDNIELLHWAVSELSGCPAVLSLPSISSLYFWLNQKPPTGMLSNNTFALLSSQQQRSAISDLDRQPDLCVLVIPAILNYFDRGQLASKPPLLRYVEENFRVVRSEGPFQVLRRNPN